jgi:hypothetical protein
VRPWSNAERSGLYGGTQTNTLKPLGRAVPCDVVGHKLVTICNGVPKAAHDDQVDAFVQGVRYATGSSDRRGFFRWLAEEKARMVAEGLLPPDLSGAAQGA